MSWLGVEVSVMTILVLSLFPFNAFGSLECVLHIKLDSVDRSAGFPLGRVISCDKSDITNNLWYRFTGAAGSAMSTSCVPERHCGTHSPGWLKGPLPSKSQGVVNRRVCYHWQGDCCKFQNKIRVRNCGKFFVYRLVKPPHCNLRYCGNAGQGTPAPTKPQTKPPTTSLPVPIECQSYTALSDADRAPSYHVTQPIKCDKNDISKKWYRFTGAAGSAMPTNCVSKNHCGTHAPGWLDGSHPKKLHGIVTRKVCFSWNNNCCFWNNNIRIRNCGGFYVYELVRTPQCHLRYCGNGQAPTIKPAITTKNPGNYPNECRTYTVLSSRDRAQGEHRGNLTKCDKHDLTKRWYRFMGDAGTQIATSCVPDHHCGTHSPGWMRGSHPRQGDGVVTRRVCYNWIGNCCHWYNNIRVRNCGGFYVYELIKQNYCYLRYCGNGGPAPTTKPPVPTNGPDLCVITKPCQNGAVCISSPGGYTCLCKPGFTGKNCELDVDECSRNPCRNGATCINNFGGYRCKCTAEFQGKHCDIDVNECIKKPCQNGGTCSNKPGGYTCYCPIGILGKDCETDIDECQSQPCQNGGTCQNNVGGYKCFCHPGFNGQNCEKDIDECSLKNPCQNGATCVNSKGSYTCQCLPGFTGKHCDQDIDECSLKNPCQNGATCVNSKGSYTCQCLPGFTGKHCDQDIDECSLKNPCQNGATCVNSKGSYTCQCLPGFTGKHCDQDIDECSLKNPCQNGATCVNSKGSYTCQCLPGFTGKHCDQDIDECSLKNPCQNGATCVNSKGSYTCQCLPGFTGNHCDQDIDECSLKNPCQNGATCVNSKGSYTCQCLPGFTGKHCDQDIDECSLKNPCQNGATCVNSKGSYTCQCLPGFTGNHCDQDIDECLKNPCQNGATCVNNDGGYNCRCLPGFTGKHCDQDIDECSLKNPCQNGATCVNNDGGYNCSCLPGFTGKHCELEPTTKPGPVQYNKVGCFFDKGKPNSRPFPTLLANLRPEIDWNDLVTTVINKCAKKALKNEYKYFGIQFYGECWSGPNSKVKYDIDGPSSNCPAGVGAGGSLMVYKIVS